MRVAICDDEKEEIAKIHEAMAGIQDNYRADTFQSCSALLDAVRSGEKYDLLFCDIYLNGENGLEAAKELQTLSPDTAIVFTTSSREHAVEAFSIRALHYLIKPIRREDIVEAFRRMDKRAEPRHMLTIRIDRSVNVLDQSDIIRVESHGHNTVITCLGGTVYSIRKPFREINGMLDSSFIQIKKGVTLNMRTISKMTSTSCTTGDGLSYLLRRDRAREIRETYIAFLNTELNKP